MMKISKRSWIIFGLIDGLLLFGVLLFFGVIPFGIAQNDRGWALDQQVLAEVSIVKDRVSVKNVRNFAYKTVDDYDPSYYDAVYNADDIKQVWYLIEPFGDRDGPAHTMVSFDFFDGPAVTVSAEIRKEKGESFSAIKGLFDQYEMVYMVGDDRDLIRLRTNYRKDRVHMYPLVMSDEGKKRFFLSIMQRAEQLRTNPEFYHTIQNTCTTVLMDHANELLEKDIPWDKRILLPKDSDEILLERGLIDTNFTSLSEIRAYYDITQKAQLLEDDRDFSQKIRPVIK